MTLLQEEGPPSGNAPSERRKTAHPPPCTPPRSSRRPAGRARGPHRRRGAWVEVCECLLDAFDLPIHDEAKVWEVPLQLVRPSWAQRRHRPVLLGSQPCQHALPRVDPKRLDDPPLADCAHKVAERLVAVDLVSAQAALDRYWHVARPARHLVHALLHDVGLVHQHGPKLLGRQAARDPVARAATVEVDL
eukprot:CAMPEP_0206283450 /NCGR_PEP_ID=MMETSP0047_2-20121206/40231_1 /ASSEMBLY_ACC=CAM_ASM_000192 /TAXON_ID=195065 /ORGANISM="Chroomonas mesostigmatica_cf, Strain CCMP1168" /LENGTH=189 /DNA_ID=CAMNT_0053713805 /DNA_START=231 /DNA_END=802 /DNA_ORIENTATION=+